MPLKLSSTSQYALRATSRSEESEGMVAKSMAVRNQTDPEASFIETTFDYIRAFTDRQCLQPRPLHEED